MIKLNQTYFNKIFESDTKVLLTSKFETVIKQVIDITVKTDSSYVKLKETDLDGIMKNINDTDNYYYYNGQELYVSVLKTYWNDSRDIIIAIVKIPSLVNNINRYIDIPVSELSRFIKYLIVESAKLRSKPIPQHIYNDLLGNQ